MKRECNKLRNNIKRKEKQGPSTEATTLNNKVIKMDLLTISTTNGSQGFQLSGAPERKSLVVTHFKIICWNETSDLFKHHKGSKWARVRDLIRMISKVIQ